MADPIAPIMDEAADHVGTAHPGAGALLTVVDIVASYVMIEVVNGPEWITDLNQRLLRAF
ncbi:hypothetical protein [Streptomyces sp. Ac-502]|uniref:hypothetical protein n=1 Tax=Streptomyces sp. Ac-502 TaxID=3342801 RepID=UPI0038623BD8